MRSTLIKILTIALVASIALAACIGPDGNAQLKYSWVSVPQYFYDENPSTPSIIYNDVYFDTNPGTYYMEYISWDDSAWWMTYQITVNRGSLLLMPGDDLWFEITLYSSGPTLWKWPYQYSITEAREVRRAVEPSQYHSNLHRGPVIGTEVRTHEYGSIRIEYGRLIPDKGE